MFNTNKITSFLLFSTIAMRNHYVDLDIPRNIKLRILFLLFELHQLNSSTYHGTYLLCTFEFQLPR